MSAVSATDGNGVVMVVFDNVSASVSMLQELPAKESTLEECPVMRNAPLLPG